jgi:signal transduction histidine kinase
VPTFLGILGIVAAAAAALACGAAARSPGRTRWCWGLMSIGAAAWIPIAAVWMIPEARYGVSIALIAVVPAVLVGFGTALLPGAPSATAARGRTLVDGLIVGGSVLFTAWALGLSDLYQADNRFDPAGLLVQTLAYVVAGSATIVIVTRAHPMARPTLALVGGGICALAVASAGLTYRELGGATGAVGWLCSGWAVGWLTLGMAARRQAGLLADRVGDEQVQPGLPTQMSVFIPSTVFAIAVVAAAAEGAGGGLDGLEVWVAGVVIVLIVARQVLALLENISFWRRLEVQVRGLAEERGELVRQIVKAEDRTRRRIAEALHDEAMQSLLAANQELFAAAPGRVGVTRAHDGVKTALERLRVAVQALHPVPLQHGDLAITLNAIAREQAERGGFRQTVRIAPEAAGHQDALVLSVARELLVNVANHAHASQCSVIVGLEGEEIDVQVVDDGQGIPPGRRGEALRAGHVGLAITAQRINALGGELDVFSEPGRGTTVRASIPISDSQLAQRSG